MRKAIGQIPGSAATHTIVLTGRPAVARVIVIGRSAAVLSIPSKDRQRRRFFMSQRADLIAESN
jgi:hypothetical protein